MKQIGLGILYPPHNLGSPLLSSDQEALLCTFPKSNDAVDGGVNRDTWGSESTILQATTRWTAREAGDKFNLRLYLFIYTYLLSLYHSIIVEQFTVFVPFKGIKISVELKALESLAYSSVYGYCYGTYLLPSTHLGWWPNVSCSSKGNPHSIGTKSTSSQGDGNYLFVPWATTSMELRWCTVKHEHYCRILSLQTVTDSKPL